MKIELPAYLSNQNDGEESPLSCASMCLDAYGENNFLYRIANIFTKFGNMSSATLRFIVNDFGPFGDEGRQIETTEWKSNGIFLQSPKYAVIIFVNFCMGTLKSVFTALTLKTRAFTFANRIKYTVLWKHPIDFMHRANIYGHTIYRMT